MRFVTSTIIILSVFMCMGGCQRARLTASKPGGSVPVKSADAQFVTVEMGQGFVNVLPDTIKAGEVHFDITNAGMTDHVFAIKGNGVDEKATTKLEPGQKMQSTIRLEPGNYFIYCPEEGCKDLGIITDMTVQ